jgi:hypothetical protein
MPAIETYVVRFYRRAAEQVAGTVETVSDGAVASFVGFDELRTLLEAGVPCGDDGISPPPFDPGDPR